MIKLIVEILLAIFLHPIAWVLCVINIVNRAEMSGAKKVIVESCGAQAAQAKEATSTGANVLEIPERGAQEPTPAWAEMGVADPTISFSAAC